ncbi:MAG: ATP-binding cassette domain-containing protein [Acidobacteria bacterium]|nr:ATP-binding cassette domain-containing protein [Acidobacteriota bacterium]
MIKTAAPDDADRPIAELRNVVAQAPDGTTILSRMSLRIDPGAHHVVLGPNGSGKSTLIGLLSMYVHPASGSVEVLGEQLGRTDVRTLRSRIGLLGGSVQDLLRPTLSAHDIVVTARHGALEPWWHEYDADDHDRADELLDLVGCENMGRRAFATLSVGERQRALLARALMSNPKLLLLDEPAAGLDLAARESLVATMAEIAVRSDGPTMVLVTHHVEEIAPGFSRVIMLRDGHVVASGPTAETMTDKNLSATFDLDVTVEHDGDRFWARATIDRDD